MTVQPLTINLERMAREIDAAIQRPESRARAAAVLEATSRAELNMLLEVADERNLTHLIDLVVVEFNRRDERED